MLAVDLLKPKKLKVASTEKLLVIIQNNHQIMEPSFSGNILILFGNFPEPRHADSNKLLPGESGSGRSNDFIDSANTYGNFLLHLSINLYK